MISRFYLIMGSVRIRLKRGGLHAVELVNTRGTHHPWTSLSISGIERFLLGGGTRGVFRGFKVIATVLFYSYGLSLRKSSKYFEKLSTPSVSKSSAQEWVRRVGGRLTSTHNHKGIP